MVLMENYERINKSWEVITNVLIPSSLGSQATQLTEDEEIKFQEAVEIMHESQLTRIIEDWFIECVQKEMQNVVVPKFWDYFHGDCTSTSTSSSAGTEQPNFVAAVEYIYAELDKYQKSIEHVEAIKQKYPYQTGRAGILFKNSLKETITTHCKAMLFTARDRKIYKATEDFYMKAFKVYQNDQGDEDLDESINTERCAGCEEKQDKCKCTEFMQTFHTINRKLDKLNLLSKVAGSCITTIVHRTTKQHIEYTCRGNVETSFLESLEKWLDKKVLGWLDLVWCSDQMSPTQLQSLKEFKDTLRQYMYENYARTLIDQLFSIIIDYPESEPAILDLKSCLMKTDLRSHLVVSLKDALESRLLHPGVNTSNILAAYISAIRALRVLDPAGVILELVCEPVQKYLRGRDNTVRCIVSSLTEEGVNELSDELIRGLPHIVDDNTASDDENEDWNKWVPDPVDADPASMSKLRRTSDIISMLVNIYGSKELFVNEYRNLLADRILSQFNYDTEREIRYLELLKLRFGEAQLHYCEVMLKDVTDSRRINSIIKENKKKEEPEGEDDEDIEINSMILSAQFWPTFREEKLNLPDSMQRCLENYTKKFESLKGNRTLIWKPHLGLVNIDIELKERTLNLNVSPVHAAIIMQFQNKDQWTVEELSGVLQIPATALRRKIAYWQSQGLLKEEATDTFILVEEQRANSDDIMLADEEETESAMASMRAQLDEQMQVFWTYIVGMLTNLESLPIERIHSMLRMFAVQGPSTVECSIGELKAFLDKKVKEQKLIYSSGVYRLSRNN